tara:strand:+ start:1018 stop:1428 length:411 start_codon:yes stop_codon:yes gene_type:complete
MAASTISSSVTLGVGNIFKTGSYSTTGPDPSDYIFGTGQVGSGANSYIGGDATSQSSMGDVDGTSCDVLLFLRNDNTSGAYNLLVDLTAAASGQKIKIPNGHCNLLSVQTLANVRLEGDGGTVNYTFMAVQVGANS